jgi:hypothetical protein
MPTKTLLSASSPRVPKSKEAPSASGGGEILLQDATVSICLLVNRRHKHLRVIDFRAGPTIAKRNLVLAAARREGVEKVFTLVERDEVATWTRLGFSREGSIPSFYRRNDAWIMGIVVAGARPLPASALADVGDDDEPADEVPESAALALAERTIARAKKLARDEAPSSVKLSEVGMAEARKAILAAEKKGTALTGFEPFGRDAVRATFACSARGLTLHVSAEAQPFFQSSFVELLATPRTDAERSVATAAIGAVCERLRSQGAASAFAVGPADDAAHAATFLANGFRRSAALAQHLAISGKRRDAIVWWKKIAQVD